MSKSIPVFEPQGELTPESLRLVLGLVCNDVPEAVIALWTPNERKLAYDWAMREHLHASDNNSVRRRECPWFVKVAKDVNGESLKEHELRRLVRMALEESAKDEEGILDWLYSHGLIEDDAQEAR